MSEIKDTAQDIVVQAVTKTVFIGKNGAYYATEYEALCSLLVDRLSWLVDSALSGSSDLDGIFRPSEMAKAIMERGSEFHQLLDVLVRAKAAQVTGG